MRRQCFSLKCLSAICWIVVSYSDCGFIHAETPSAAYIFPAGARRGTAVDVRIGGHFLHDKAEFLLHGAGVEATSPIARAETTWFEGPILLLPASQQKEDYPKDYGSRVTVTADASLGIRRWHCVTSQGITAGMKFVVGDLPEILEDETARSATSVTLPVTINGRIFPREDADDWAFEAHAGQVVTCEVNAARIGSGLDSRLEVRDPSGRVIAENSDAFGADSFVRFTAPADGRYVVRIHDVRFDGLQHFVYRLTISAGPWLDSVFPLGGQRGAKTTLQLVGANLPNDRAELLIPNGDSVTGLQSLRGLPLVLGGDAVNTANFETDDLTEHLETERADGEVAGRVTLPCVLNGVIARAGEADSWILTGKKGDVCQFDLRASRLGSELDGVLTLLDAKGNTLGSADDLASGQTDAVLNVTLPVDGDFTLKVQDRISSRGGPQFGYRVRITDPRTGSLRLTTPLDAITLVRGGEVRIKVLAERPNGFDEEVTLEIEGLPEGVAVTGNKLGKGQAQVDVALKAEATAKLLTSRLRIVGKWKAGEVERSVATEVAQASGEPQVSELLLRIGLPTPFKLKGIFETKYVPRGSVFTRRFRVERNGFTGPMWAELADRQARYLQGVTGPRIAITADATEFEYPFTLPSWMEVGRTSRSCVAVFGEIEEPDGTRHVVSHTSQNQDDQAIVLVEPNRLSLETSRNSIRWTPGGEARIPVRISRSSNLRGVVRVEPRWPRGLIGVQCEAIEVPDGVTTGEVLVRFAADAVHPSAAPIRVSERLTLRSTMQDERGLPLTDEIAIDVVVSSD